MKWQHVNGLYDANKPNHMNWIGLLWVSELIKLMNVVEHLVEIDNRNAILMACNLLAHVHETWQYGWSWQHRWINDIGETF
jgi:hypothetical protein